MRPPYPVSPPQSRPRDTSRRPMHALGGIPPGQPLPIRMITLAGLSVLTLAGRGSDQERSFFAVELLIHPAFGGEAVEAPVEAPVWSEAKA